MGCGPSKTSLSRVADSTCEYNRCYMKEFDKARHKQKKSGRQSRRNNPTYNNFSSTSKVYDRASGTSKITVRLSTDGSMLEIEQFDVEYDSTGGMADVTGSIDDDQGLVMKSVSELKASHKHGNLYGRCDSAPLLISGAYAAEGNPNKHTGCGLTSCCIQNWSNSRTILDEYKPKSTSIEQCGQDSDVLVEHSCQVHRDYEPYTKTNDGKSLDSDSLNSNSCKIMNVLTDTPIAIEPVRGPNGDFQNATIHVKRSSLEQQVKDAYKHGVDSHLFHSCSTFKPFAKTERKHQNGSQFVCKNNDDGFKADSLCRGQRKHTAVATIGESSTKSHYTNSMREGVNDLELNQTEASLIDNYESRLDNRITEKNQSCRICSTCDYDKNTPEICQCTHMPDVCRAFETITQINNEKQYQCQVCSSCEAQADGSMSCCCCFTTYSSHRENAHQCLPCSIPGTTNLPVDNHTNNDTHFISNKDETMMRVGMVGSAQYSNSIDRHKCMDCGKKMVHSFTCTHRSTRHVAYDTNIEPTPFTTSMNDGNMFQTTCGYNTSDISHSSQHTRSHLKHVTGVPDLLQIRRCNELPTQRPSVPNKTIGQNLDIHAYNNSHCLQKSIDKTERLHHEQFTVNKRVNCVHNEMERRNVENLEAVVMVTNEVHRPILKDDEQPCNDPQCTGRSDQKERCNYCDEMADIVEKDVYHDTCNCRKPSFGIASKEYRLADYRGDIDEQLEDNRTSLDKIDPEKPCSEIFPFNEYESFVVRDTRRVDIRETRDVREARDVRETLDENGNSAVTPLMRPNIEESSSSDDNISSDDVDFDEGSSDEGRDEYVDALETTYV